MKNAMVLEDHFGDDGSVTAGMILVDVVQKRFEELEKKGLVREATEEEVKAGSQHDIEPDPSAEDGGTRKKRAPVNKKAADPANKAAV